MGKENTQREAIPNDKLLSQLLKSIQPVNFILKAYPESLDILKQMEMLKPHVLNADGSFNDVNQNEISEYNRLQKKLTGLKLNKAKYMIIVLDEIARIAKEKDFGLCKRNGSIYCYNGCYWSLLDKDKFAYFLGKAALAMGMNQFECRPHTFREDIYKQFLSEAYLEVKEPDENATLICLLNGTYEISSNGKSKLREFRKSDFLTYQLPFEYDKDAKAPLFDKYINQVLPDVEKQNVLSEFTGSIFIRPKTLKLEKFLTCYGSGANGKSLYFDLLNSLLGKENISNYSLQSLTDSTGYTRAKLGGSLLNYSSELSSKMDPQIFKQLTSQEPIECRLPYGEPFILTEFSKLAANTNVLPKNTEITTGFFRRFLLIHFDQEISEKDQDRDLAGKIIAAEKSGMFNWILQGLDRLLKNRGFSPCKAMDEALSMYRTESDSVMMFISDNGYEISEKGYTLMQNLFRDYRFYCTDNGYRPVNLKNFSNRLLAMKFLRKRKGGGYAFNIVRPSADADF